MIPEILAEDFTEAAGKLTPTLKIRRREITRRYKSHIDRLYEKDVKSPLIVPIAIKANRP